MKRLGDGLVSDDAYGPGLALKADGQTVTLGSDVFTRAAAPVPAALPDKWKGLVGEYGWDHNTLYILEEEGKLRALIEWFTSTRSRRKAPTATASRPGASTTTRT